MEKKNSLDLNVNEIYNTLDNLQSEMMGSLIVYLDQLPNKRLDFSHQIVKSCYNATVRELFPIIKDAKPSYVSEIYLKKDTPNRKGKRT